MIVDEPGTLSRLVLSDPTLKIVGMAHIKRAAVAVEHVSPEAHWHIEEEGQAFDKLRPNGGWA